MVMCGKDCEAAWWGERVGIYCGRWLGEVMGGHMISGGVLREEHLFQWYRRAYAELFKHGDQPSEGEDVVLNRRVIDCCG